jgi:small subunit ribosomal protein S8
LKREGYVVDYATEKVEEKECLRVMLKYDAGRPLITGVRRVSKPGRRNYVGAGEIPRVMDGLGIAIISTPQGLMVGRRARKKKIGGEVVCEIW